MSKSGWIIFNSTAGILTFPRKWPPLPSILILDTTRNDFLFHSSWCVTDSSPRKVSVFHQILHKVIERKVHGHVKRFDSLLQIRPNPNSSVRNPLSSFVANCHPSSRRRPPPVFFANSSISETCLLLWCQPQPWPRWQTRPRLPLPSQNQTLLK